MKVLLCAATEMEIAPTIQFLSLQPNYGVDVLITGVGLLACTFSLTKYVSNHRPKLIIQAGIAGCFDKNLSLSQIAVIRNETVGDLGVKEGPVFQSLFDLKLIDPNTFPWKKGKLCNENKILQEAALPVLD